MKILFNLASRSRPQKLINTINNVLANVVSDQYEFCIVLDANDPTVTPELEYNLLALVNPGEYHIGNSLNKVDAINRNVKDHPTWDILVNCSDDMVFTEFAFDNIIRFHMPEDLDCYLHFRDSNQDKPDALCTMSILGRKYFDRDGFIYHPDFQSLWCDNFSMDVAKARGKYRFVNEIIFDHQHPSVGKAPLDSQYRKTEAFYYADQKVYKRLKPLIRKMI